MSRMRIVLHNRVSIFIWKVRDIILITKKYNGHSTKRKFQDKKNRKKNNGSQPNKYSAEARGKEKIQTQKNRTEIRAALTEGE